MLLAMVVVPQLGGDEDVLPPDETFCDGSLNTLASFLFILVVVCTIEQTVPNFDGLRCVSVTSR